MRTYPPCIQCITDVRLRDIRATVPDPDEAVEKQLELLSAIRNEFARGGELTVIASRIFYRLIKIEPRVAEYYRRVRRSSIDKAQPLLPRIRDLLEGFSGYDEFRLAVKFSIAGNTMDTGVSGHTPPETIDVEEVLSTPITVDHTREIYEAIRGGNQRILWLFDNAGEAVLDTLLIGVMRSYGNKVVAAAKEDPGFQNDLTISDAEYAGIRGHVDRLVSTGYMGSSIHLHRVSKELLDELEKATMVVAKGMAHFEYISGLSLGKPVAYLLTPKCDIISMATGGARGTYVALLRRQ